MYNILIVYWYNRYPARATHLEHLYSFKKYAPHRCFYINLAAREIPWYLKKIDWDLIIFHTFFLSSRWTRELFIENIEKVRCLKNSNAVKVIIPQDEFLNMDLVCDFINEFSIDHVFSVAPESEWSTIYRTVDRQKVQFHRVLTGYIDDSAVKKVKDLANGVPVRSIDIGYRTHKIEYWLGRHGIKKEIIADIFKDSASQKGLMLDISNRIEDTITGDDWYRFLLRCKYQIGIEGGASILDWDGTYRKRTKEYIAQHPNASLEEVESACFPGVDGSLKLFALSPRNFEACLTKTCQVLVEGDYNGIFLPWKHYIPIRSDFGDIDETLRIIKEDRLREEITAKAWKDIVESGKYTYRGFVDYVINNSLFNFSPKSQSLQSKLLNLLIYYWTLNEERLSSLYVVSYVYLFRIFKRLPHPLRVMIRRYVS